MPVWPVLLVGTATLHRSWVQFLPWHRFCAGSKAAAAAGQLLISSCVASSRLGPVFQVAASRELSARAWCCLLGVFICAEQAGFEPGQHVLSNNSLHTVCICWHIRAQACLVMTPWSLFGVRC